MSEFYRVDTGANGSVFVRNTSALNYVIAHSEGAGSTSITGGSVGISNTSPVAKFEVHDTAGELLSINNDLTSTVFSANDVSGLPMIEATANGNVIINRFRQGNLDVRGGILGESDSYTKLLIHSDTNDGNTCFIDSSSSGHTLTVTGDAHHETTQKKFGSTAIQFDGTGDYLSTPANDDFDLVGDFTLDWWAWKSANGSVNYDGVMATTCNGSFHEGWGIELSSTRGLFFYEGITNTTIISDNTTSPNDSTWHHWAIVRSGSTVTAYKDGVSIDSCAYGTGSINAGHPLLIGSMAGGSSGAVPTYHFNFYMDEVRIYN